jgi:hypothetical protein
MTVKLLNRQEKRKLRRNGHLDTIKITGLVRIIQGGKVVAEKRNHFVNTGLISLINYLGVERTTSDFYGHAYNWSASPFSQGFIVLGTDTTTATVPTMESLTSPIGTAPGTKANSQSLACSNPSSGVYEVTYTATWNAGTVSGTIGEIGLYGYAAYILGSISSASRMVSRLSVADGDFTAYTINTSLPLTVQWVVRFSFA